MMVRMGEQSSDAERKPSVSAAGEANDGGIPIRPDHISDPSCWCGPIEVEPGVWLHHPAPPVLPFEEREPQLDGYVPDIEGVIEGDDGPPRR